MTEQVIESRDITVTDIFQAFYQVPNYQREYVWKTEHVEQLLNDINAERERSDPARAPEYFIGSIVVCPGNDSVLEVIDGQQRLTTLFLTLCAIRDRIKEFGEEPPGSLDSHISATSTDAGGSDHFRYRLDLQYEDSGDILVHIAKETLNEADDKSTRSITNIRNAYTVTLNFLKQEFRDDVGALRAFYGYLTNKVKLIRIQTKDVAKALKIFETINDRGVGLDAMDLLKNLLFMKASRSDFEKLKGHWKELQDALFDMNEKPLRFLRYFIFSRYDVDILREDEIYGWFAKNEDQCGYAVNPSNFAKELLRAAQAYGRFRDGCDPSGAKNRHLENLQLLGGWAARQHLILLLAGRHLPVSTAMNPCDLFDQLAREVEDLFFVYVITREPTRVFERNFARWARELRDITNSADLEVFIDRRFVRAKAELSVRFDEALRRLYVDSVQQYRLLYILAKLTQHIDLRAYGETEGTKWLSNYTSGGFEIEHIFPQQPSNEATVEFGEREDPYIADRLGNLVLVERSINASLGNRPYSQKRDVYPKSRLLLTNSLAERPAIGNTKIDSAVLDPFTEWNEAAVIERQNKLTVLARSVWRLPTSSVG